MSLAATLRQIWPDIIGRLRLAGRVWAWPIAWSVLAGYPALAQATYTASRAGDLQVGAGFVVGNSNFLTPELGGTGESLRGLNLYSTFDFRKHIGADLEFRQASPSYGENVYERTYEAGGRYVYPVGRLRPYGKVLYGRGVFNYPHNVANLAYNLLSLGAGLDYQLSRQLNVRIDYEHGHWFGFPLQALSPNIVSIGVAYHFSGEGRCLYCARR